MQRGDEGLVRGIGPLGLTAGVVNAVVGGGIFVLPAAVAAELGSAGVLAYVVCGFAILLVTISLAIAGTTVSRTGGAYAYVETAFGPFAGYLAGMLTWLSGTLASAGLIAALAGIAASLAPGLQGPAARVALVAAIYAIPVVVNLLDIRTGTRLIITATAVKLATLALFLGLAIPAADTSSLGWSGPVDPLHLGRATILAFFALAGMEAAIGASGEIKEPRRTVPIGLLGGMTLVVFTYIVIHLVAQGVLDGRLADSPAPLADAAASRWPAARAVMLAGMAFSMLGLLTGNLLGSSRVLFAFARDGLLPRAVASLHPRTRIPHVAVLLHASIAAVLAATRTFTKLAILASVTVAVLYGMVCVAAVLLARRPQEGGLSLPVGAQRSLAGLGALGMLWLLAQSTAAEFGAIAAAMALAATVFAVTIRSRSRAARLPAG